MRNSPSLLVSFLPKQVFENCQIHDCVYSIPKTKNTFRLLVHQTRFCIHAIMKQKSKTNENLQYTVGGFVSPGQAFGFLFSKLQKQRLNARSRSIRVGVTVHCIHQNKNKTDKVGFSPKARKFGHTKQTCYTVADWGRFTHSILMYKYEYEKVV